MERRSRITSFKSNRFNNLFQAAAALHFHRSDISDCLGACLAKQNKKIESVFQDNLCDTVDTQLIALGLLYHRVTGPYWCLLGTDLHYLRFYAHVVMLQGHLQRWAADSSSAFDTEFEPLFGITFPKDDIFQSLVHLGPEKKAEVKVVLEALCAGCLQVLERQLKEFLPGGEHHAVDDEDLLEKTKHSKLTNLVGEQCFGDLDFSLFKRRNASLHHHSTINILKRNRSISAWFGIKTDIEQRELLVMSAKKAPALRKQHVASEKEAVAKRAVLLEETRQKKQDEAERKRQRINNTIQKLNPHQGPCIVAADIDRLLATYTTRTTQKSAVQADMRYQTLVLGMKSPLLRITGSLLFLTNNLRVFLGGTVEGITRQQLPPLPRQTCQPPGKRQRCDNSGSSEEEDSNSDEDLPDHPDDAHDIQQEFQEFDFKFQREGQMVAVYFMEDFYVGEVMTVFSEEKAEVNFMDKANFQIRGQPVFRWPMRQDKCTIDSEVVFACDVELTPSSSSGRAFLVVQPVDLQKKYAAFKLYLYHLQK